MPRQACLMCSRRRTGWGRWRTRRTRPSGHVLRVRGEGQDEGGSEHIKHAQTGVFYVFAVFGGWVRTRGILAVERLVVVVVVVVLNGDGGRVKVTRRGGLCPPGRLGSVGVVSN
jgi:hypothetical protein